MFLAQAEINAIAPAANEAVYVGGRFEEVGEFVRSNIVRLNKDGSVDPNWQLTLNDDVQNIVALRNGDIIVQGDFGLVNGDFYPGMVKVDPNGVLDPTFPALAPSGDVYRLIELANRQLLVAGEFQPDGMAGDTKFLVRLEPDGSHDPTFETGFDNLVEEIALAPDQKIYAAGAFNFISGVAHQSMVRLEENGAVDPAFSLVVERLNVTYPSTIKLQNDNSIAIGGHFDHVNGTPQRFLAVIESNGDLRESFTPLLRTSLGPDPDTGIQARPVSAIVNLLNGQLVVAGNVGPNTEALDYRFLQRFNEDGSVDDSFFDATLDGVVSAAAVDAAGNLLIGGNFTQVGEVATGQVARVAIGLDITPLCIVTKASNGNVIQFCL